MKNMYLTIMAAALAILSSCGGDKGSEPAGAATFTLSSEQIDVDNQQQKATLTVTGSADWSVYSDKDWCAVSPSGGLAAKVTEVALNIAANSGSEARTATLTFKSGTTYKKVSVSQRSSDVATTDLKEVTVGGNAQTSLLKVTSNAAWTISSDQSWITLNPTGGQVGTTSVALIFTKNETNASRMAKITIKAGTQTLTVPVTQLSDVIVTPAGYTLVWDDEFNAPRQSNGKPAMLDGGSWYYETGNSGWGNNELQNYIAGAAGTDTCASLVDGMLKIAAKTVGTQVISARVNTKSSWKYGYFEARMKLPAGIGTWPAFWMMPKVNTAWPDDGEIDIMEEVGYNANYVSSSIHCKDYNHILGTQKTAEVLCPTAQSEFHVYALEWTETYIKTYVDGKQLFYFANDGKGDKATWPFNTEFYVKLNLAWGGNWGGAKGVDPKALPATYLIDYVRVFQKK